MSELLDILSLDESSLLLSVGNVPDNYPVDVDTVVGNEVQVRIAGTAEAGKYSFNVSSNANVDSTLNAVFSRYSLDGGATWEEASRSASNSGDSLFFMYSFPYDHAGGAYDFVLQMKKESAQNTLNVVACSIWFQRIG